MLPESIIFAADRYKIYNPSNSDFRMMMDSDQREKKKQIIEKRGEGHITKKTEQLRNTEVKVQEFYVLSRKILRRI